MRLFLDNRLSPGGCTENKFNKVTGHNETCSLKVFIIVILCFTRLFLKELKEQVTLVILLSMT